MPVKRKPGAAGQQLSLAEMSAYAAVEIGSPVKTQGCELREVNGKAVQILFYRYMSRYDGVTSHIYRWKLFVNGKATTGGIL